MKFTYAVGNREITDDIDVETCTVTRTIAFNSGHSKQIAFYVSAELLVDDADLRKRFETALKEHPTSKTGVLITKANLAARHCEVPTFLWSYESNGWQGIEGIRFSEDQRHISEVAHSLTALYDIAYREQARVTELEKRLILAELEIEKLRKGCASDPDVE